MSDRAARFALRVTAAGRNGVLVFAHSGHLGPAGPRTTQSVQTGFSQRPQVRLVAVLGWR